MSERRLLGEHWWRDRSRESTVIGAHGGIRTARGAGQEHDVQVRVDDVDVLHQVGHPQAGRRDGVVRRR